MPLTTDQVLQGNYRIIGSLGHGGMGAVYLAEHTRLSGRRFAIKENIPESNADPQTLAELRNQFYVEAKTLAALDHPNLPKVSDFFTQGNNEYLVMDFVEGETLQQVFDRHIQQFRAPLPEQSVLDWADQVLDALTYLHGQRPSPIVHRDIKPSNIILTPTGVVKLVDFGLVKLVGQGSQDTAFALRGLGTPAYTALEQYPGSEGHTDARTDIYALGATLYHLLTGSPPANVRDRLLNPKVLDKPRRLNPGLSAQTEAALLKAIEVHPSQRFQSASQMRVALGGKARRAAAPPGSATPPAPARRRRWTIPVTMIALLALLGTVVWAWFSGLFSSSAGDIPTPVGGATIVVAALSETTPSPTITVIITEVPTALVTDTPIPETPTLTSTATDTSVVATLAKPTSTLGPNTPTPSPTATLAVPRAVASGETNLRAGPGTQYAAVGILAPGAALEISGKNQAGTWWQLKSADGSDVWIIADRVETTGPTDSVAVVDAPPTPTPAATPTPARPGLVADFESGPTWRIGDQNYGTLAPSREQAMVGASSGRLSYTFPAVNSNYVVFLAPNPIGMGGQPTGVTAWVYGDGSGHYLNAWVRDTTGEVRAYSFGQVFHSGWQQMVAWFDDTSGWPNGHISGSDNGRLDYPVSLYALVLDGVPDNAASSGVIYLDELSATSGSIPAPTPIPVPVASPTPAPSSGTTRSALLPGAPAPIQTAGVGGLLGLGALLGVWLVTGKPRRRRP